MHAPRGGGASSHHHRSRRSRDGAGRSGARIAERQAGRVGFASLITIDLGRHTTLRAILRSVVACRLPLWGSRPALPVRSHAWATPRPRPCRPQTIPPALQGNDVLARAQTGTGKTAAFGLPMIERLAAADHGQGLKPRGLVLVPTRELALQVQESLRGFAQATRLRAMTMVGGEPIMPQVRTLRRGVDIVVATPGRLIDHLDRRTIDLSAVEIVVLDEADRMLDMGFLPPLKRIMTTVPTARQTLLLSATLSHEIIAISKTFIPRPGAHRRGAGARRGRPPSCTACSPWRRSRSATC